MMLYHIDVDIDIGVGNIIEIDIANINTSFVVSNNINSNKTQISLNNMEPGTYLVNVSDKYKQIKTFQIVKN